MPGDQRRQLPREAARGGHRPAVEGEGLGSTIRRRRLKLPGQAVQELAQQADSMSPELNSQNQHASGIPSFCRIKN